MSVTYSVGWEDDRLPLPSEFRPPAAAVDVTACCGPRRDDAVWIDASQGSEYTQRLPVRVATAPALKIVRNPAHLESVEFLKGVVQHPSQYYADQELDNAKLKPASVAIDADTPNPSPGHFSPDLANDSQMESAAAVDTQDGAESGDSQRTDSYASSDNVLREEDEESEASTSIPLLRHACAYCAYRTSRKAILIQHTRTHTGSKPFRCDKCDYRAAERSNLTKHLRRHTGERPFRCVHCDFRATNHSNLTEHSRKHTGVKPYACPRGNCNYQTAYQSALGRHLRTHTKEKPHKCPQCDYRTTHKWTLNEHIRTHTGEKPYKCMHCGHRATQRGNFNRHLLTHTAEKPYECTLCDYRTTQKGALYEHIRKHTGAKPFACPRGNCDFRTAYQGAVGRHVRTHTKEKPHKCPQCDYRTTQKGALDEHLRKHTG